MEFESNNTTRIPKQRLTRGQRNKDNKAWYKENANFLDKRAFSSSVYSSSLAEDLSESFDFHGVSDWKRMKTNYDLFNNIINIREFEYVSNPYGLDQELPANFANRDIISQKIKSLIGMEIKRPFPWKVMAVNEEATTRREQEEFRRIKEFVINEVMGPIQIELEKKKQAQIQGQPLTPEQEKQIEQQLQEELKTLTPPEVKRYMEREHQDPAEVQAQQLLEYIMLNEQLPQKFNDGFKHLAISAKEFYRVRRFGNDLIVEVINPMRFDFANTPDLEFPEYAEWQVYEYLWSPSEVVAEFADELTGTEIDQIYAIASKGHQSSFNEGMFNFSDERLSNTNGEVVRVLHTVWRSLRRIGFLKYRDQYGIQEKMVDESYVLNIDQGDIDLIWKWIPWPYETYKIGTDIYKRMGPLKDYDFNIDNPYDCKLPYMGVIADATNSIPTSLIDRVKGYQYYYDIIMYRIEMLMASDKGKILMMNIGMLPESMGIDIEKFLYYAESSKIGFLNPNEEGNRGDNSITNAVKEIDMSLASDIQKYINLAEYIERKAGVTIGVPPEAEGQIGPNNAVTNTKQIMVQSSHILEPIFELHNIAELDTNIP